MNTLNTLNRLCGVAAIAATIAGCASAPAPLAPVAQQVPAAAVVRAAPVPSALTPMTAERPAYLDPNNPVARDHEVFFAYDHDDIAPRYTATVELQGRYLATHPQVKVRIEGNSDERGGTEYNLALGQKRAEALAHALKLLGARENQLETVSLGKEHPVASGHDETAWSQNRHADVVYPLR